MARPVLWRRMVLAILLMAGFNTLALGLTLALNQRNFLLSTMPGHPVTLTRGEVIIAWDDLNEKRLSAV